MGGRVLDPVERFSEAAFGLVMVLGFTCTLSVADEAEVRTMLYAALGCNIAWGIVDALMYLVNTLAARGRSLAIGRALLHGAPAEARAELLEALPDPIGSVFTDAELDAVRQRLKALPEPAANPALDLDDFRGALGVFLIVFLSTLPVAAPFVLIADPPTALRVSNAVAVGMLFVFGYYLGRYADYRPVGMGIGMVFVGAALVFVTIALGG